MTAPQFKQLRRAYGFDEVAIVPGDVTINPELVELGLDIGPHHFDIPVLASAMDAVVDPLVRDRDAQVRRPRGPQPRRCLDPLRRP